MIPRALQRALVSPRSLVRAASTTAWLKGSPPTVDLSAKTLASLYYGSVLTQEGTKDLIVGVDSSSTDQKFTVGDFNKQVVGYAVGMLEGLGLKKGYKVGVWMTGELEHVVVRLAAGLLGVEVVVIDPAVGFEGVKGVVASEGLHALILSPRFASQDRHAALRTQFQHELAPNQDGQLMGTHGIFPLTSKRFRALKYLVCTSTEFADEAGPLYGVVRFANLPVYGPYDFDEVAAIQHFVSSGDSIAKYYSAAGSGGSEGAGAAVLHPTTPTTTHEAALAGGKAAATSLGLLPGHVLLSTAPLHTPLGFAASVLAPSLAGAKVVLPGKVFDAQAVLAAATLQRPTAILLATHAEAAALTAALAADAAGKVREFDVSSIKSGAVVAGGAGAKLGALTLKAL